MESTFEPFAAPLDYCDLRWVPVPLFPKPEARKRYILGFLGAAVVVGPPGAPLDDGNSLYGHRRTFEQAEAILAGPLPEASDNHLYSEVLLGHDTEEIGKLFAADGYYSQAGSTEPRGFCGLSAEPRGSGHYHDQRTLEEQFPVLSVLMVLRAFPQCSGILTLVPYPAEVQQRQGRYMMRLDVTAGPGEGYQALIAPKANVSGLHSIG